MSISDATIRQTIQKYIAAIRQANIPVKQAYLFGSRAKGTPKHELSDIDICIVSPIFGKDWQKEMVLLLSIASNLHPPVPIEPIPFAPGDLEDKYSTLATEIRKYGKSIKV